MRTSRFSSVTSKQLLGRSPPPPPALTISLRVEYCRYTVLPRTCEQGNQVRLCSFQARPVEMLLSW